MFLEPCQTSKMELTPQLFLQKSFIIDVWQRSAFVSTIEIFKCNNK